MLAQTTHKIAVQNGQHSITLTVSYVYRALNVKRHKMLEVRHNMEVPNKAYIESTVYSKS